MTDPAIGPSRLRAVFPTWRLLHQYHQSLGVVDRTQLHLHDAQRRLMDEPPDADSASDTPVFAPTHEPAHDPQAL